MGDRPDAVRANNAPQLDSRGRPRPGEGYFLSTNRARGYTYWAYRYRRTAPGRSMAAWLAGLASRARDAGVLADDEPDAEIVRRALGRLAAELDYDPPMPARRRSLYKPRVAELRA